MRHTICSVPLEILEELREARLRKVQRIFVPVAFGCSAKYHVKTESLRYQVFLKSRSCAVCGIEGRVLLLEREESHPSFVAHLNLYALDANGHPVLMTKDHILPVSLGGKDDLSNLRTMCEPCNIKRGNGLVGHDKE